MRHALLLLALAIGLCGCGGRRGGGDDDDDAADGDADADADGDADADADADADGDADGDAVPDPGDEVGGEWTDVEPNDDPGHAVPVGIISGAVWAGFVEPYTQLETPEDRDFFVFATGDAASLEVHIAMCGDANTFDMYLTEVVDGMMGPEIAQSVGEDTGCATVVDFGQGPELLQPQTSYVLEVRAQPDAAGTFPALYGA
jgi:hypothetical protein